MSGPESCREAARLQKMLEGTLPPDEQATVAEHLEKCPACQMKYEELSASTRLVPEGSGKPPGPGETALHEVMERLENERPPAASEGPASAAEEVSLSFLSPPEHPGHLGRLGPYEIIEVIGQGGMGVVLKGRDPRLNRFVAVKVLAPQLAANAAARRRFTREAQAAAAVSHNHVVTIHSVDEAGGFPYLVMEYVVGCSLADRLSRTGPLELRETLRIGLQVASGLGAAHAHGLIHRDIKPANILLEDGVERVKITDFGLARAVDDVQVTRTGQLCGTPEYMSPEQARGQTVDQRSDLFSLGCVLYAMCAGRSPFRADSGWDAVNRVCNDTPRPLREVNADTPPWLTDLIEKLLAKNPGDRFQSATEVAEVLERRLAKLQHPQSPSDSTTAEIQWADQPAPQPGAKSRRERWAGAIIGLVAVLVILGMTEATGMTQLAATVIRVFRPEGTLEIVVDDPSINVTIDGEELAIQGAGPHEVRLRLGQHQFEAIKDGKPVQQQLVSITRDGKQVIKVSLDRSSPATPEQARGSVPGQFAGPPPPAATPPKQPVKGETPDATLPPTRPRTPVAAETGAVTSAPATAPVREITRETRRFYGHTSVVGGVAFSPDGRLIASCDNQDGRDCTIRIWNVADGREIRRWDPHMTGVWSVAFSPDGRSLLSGGRDKVTRLWDVETGKEIRKFEGRAGWVYSVAFSPDGRRAISSSAFGDDAIHLWDVESGAELRRLEGHSNAFAVAFSSDGKRVLSGGQDKAVILWDASSGKLLRRLEGHRAEIHGVAISPDGRLAISGGWADQVKAAGQPFVADPENCVVYVWDLQSGQLIRRLAGHEGAIHSVAFSPDGRYALSGSGGQNIFSTPLRWCESLDNSVRLWDVHSGREVCRFTGHSLSVGGVAFSPDGRFVLSCGGDRSIRLWEIPKDLLAPQRAASETVKAGQSATATTTQPAEVPAPSERPVVEPAPKATAPVREITRETRRFLGHTGTVDAVAFSPDGRLIASGGNQQQDRTIRIWDVADGHEIRRWDPHIAGGFLWSVAFSPDGRSLLSGGQDKVTRLWDVETGKEIRKFEGRAGSVYSVAFSPDGRRAISGSAFGDTAIHLWDVESGAELRRLGDHSNASSVAFSSDGKRVLSGGQDNAVILWDAASGKLLRRLEGHRTEVQSVAISPDGRLAISGGWADQVKAASQPFIADPENCVVCVWDLQSGQLIRRLAGHEGAIHSVAFSPDGRYALSGSGGQNIFSTPLRWCESRDNTVRLWDVHSGRELCRFTGHHATVRGVAFSPDGRSVLSCGYDRSIRLWEVPEDLLRPARSNATDAEQKAASPKTKPQSPPPKGGAPVEPLRTWSDATGQFNVQARLVDAADGKVVLEREDGKRITVEVKKLTADDQKYVANQRPEHQGKPLSHWIALSRRPEPKARFEALTALKQMATYSEPAQRAFLRAAGTEAVRCVGAMRVLEAIGPHAKPAAPALGKLLRDEGEHYTIRTTAAEVLGKMGAAAGPAVPDLVATLGDKQERVRLAAAEALVQIGAEAKPAVPVLIKLLSGPDLQLRRAAARVLAHKELQTKDAIPALTELLKHDTPWLRAEAAVTLSKMGPETTKLAIPVLTAAAPDRKACAALAALGPETAKVGIPPLIVSLTWDLQPGNPRIDREAIQALRDAGPEAVKAAVTVVLPLLKRPEKEAREKALSVLACLGPAVESALPGLKEILKGNDGEIRTSAMGAIWGTGSPAIPIFIELLRHGDASVRQSAAFHLGRFGEHIDNSGRYAMVAYGIRVFSDAELKRLGQEAKAAVPALVECLRDGDSNVFFHTALALRRIDPQGSAKAAVPLLVARLRDANWDTRRAAIQTLEQMRPESDAAVPVLLELLGEEDVATRCDAARVLAKMGAEPKGKAVAAMIPLLRDPDKRSRITAIATLAQIGAEAAEAAPALTELLKDTDKELRGSAAAALGKMGPQAAKAAMPVLMGLLADEDWRVAQGAALALLTMGPEGAEAGVPIVVGGRDFLGHTGGIAPWTEEFFRQKGPELVPALVRILEDREPSVRRLAMQAVPDKRSRASGSPQSENRQPAIPEPLNQSLNNLKQIGLAVHNFHDVHKHFPPAVIYGPDGKPWHSWRVLILPFVGQVALYHKYRFDEPWDGPHNKALLDSVPPVYRDPVHPGSKDVFTHYAAITGPGTAFPLEPRKPANFVPNPAGLSAATTSIRDIRDGTANTVLVGSIGLDRKIPWTKPEDMPWSDAFPGLGKPGSFATPHKFEGRPAAVFLRADGSASMERADLDLAALRKLFQVADAPRPQESKAPVAVATRATPGPLGGKAAGRGVKLLGMTIVDPSKELLRQYGLSEQYPGPVIVQQMDRSPYWASLGSPPGEGCAFWTVENPAHAFLFNQERSPSYTPRTVRELAKAILACAASPEEYQKIWDATRRKCREHAEKMKDNPKQREQLLQAAEASMPKEDVGKHICRVVYHFPKGAGTMTTYIRLGKEDLEQLRELVNSPSAETPK